LTPVREELQICVMSGPLTGPLPDMRR